ncbi:unnamed protein product [Sympodiomycopsis kandeliae]
MASSVASRPLPNSFSSEYGGAPDDSSSLQQQDQRGPSHHPQIHSQTSTEFNFPLRMPDHGSSSSDLICSNSISADPSVLGFDLTHVSDQLQFPEIPQSLLEQAPEYEYSAHTRANVFSEAHLDNYGALNYLDQYGLPILNNGEEDPAAWTLPSQPEAHLGNYDEFGNYHPPVDGQSFLVAPHPDAIIPNEEASKHSSKGTHESSNSNLHLNSNSSTSNAYNSINGNKDPSFDGITRATPPSAEYAHVTGPSVPVSLPTSSDTLYFETVPSMSGSKESFGDQEPYLKRKRPSPAASASGNISSSGTSFRYPAAAVTPVDQTPSSSPAGNAFSRLHGTQGSDSLSGSPYYYSDGNRSATHQRISSSTHGDTIYSNPSRSVGDPVPQALDGTGFPIARIPNASWSSEGDPSRGQVARGNPNTLYPFQQSRPAPGMPYPMPAPLHPVHGSMGYSPHGHDLLPPPAGGNRPSPSGPTMAASHQGLGHDPESYGRSKIGRDSISQSSEEDNFEAPPPNPKAVALAAAATKGASGTQQQADMLTALNETLSSSLETDGVARCPFPNCSKTFAKNRSYNLKTHLRSHSQLKPFACASCPRAFSRKHDLERHARVHSGDKPYICEVCGRGFPRSDALRRHWRVEKECGDRASEIESGQTLQPMPPNAGGLPAAAQVPSQTPLSKFTGPNAYPAGWLREQDPVQHRVASAGGMPPGIPVHMGVKRPRDEW